jgi:hypothetical protein
VDRGGGGGVRSFANTEKGVHCKKLKLIILIFKGVQNAFAGFVDFGTLIQLDKQTFSTLSKEIKIISFNFLQCFA